MKQEESFNFTASIDFIQTRQKLNMGNFLVRSERFSFNQFILVFHVALFPPTA